MTPATEASASARAAQRMERIARVLWAILWLNLAVAVAKLLYGWRSGAIAMTADGVHSLLDASSNVIGLVGIAVARRPPDANHPYGHRKYETFGALGVAAMLMLGCTQIVNAAIARLREPHLPAITPLGFAVLGLTITINVFVVWVEPSRGPPAEQASCSSRMRPTPGATCWRACWCWPASWPRAPAGSGPTWRSRHSSWC